MIRYAAGIGRPTMLDFLLPLAIPSPRDLLRRRIRRRWVKLIGRIIAERRDKGPQATPGDLFDLLSTARDPETGAPIAADDLVDQVATLIAAGHETTGVALFWSLHLIAAAPAVQERLAAEFAALELGPDAADEILPRLVYTRAVVQEALRLYPPAYAIVRQAPAPDRFTYLPFGIGPRVCIGAQFALTEAILVLAKMIKAFEIEPADNGSVTPIGIITTQPDRPPLFRLRPRHRAGR
jgi:cytochrome P450